MIILNIQKEEIMSCGDADNDRELLESAGLAVVMENGLDSIKAGKLYSVSTTVWL